MKSGRPVFPCFSSLSFKVFTRKSRAGSTYEDNKNCHHYNAPPVSQKDGYLKNLFRGEPHSLLMSLFSFFINFIFLEYFTFQMLFFSLLLPYFLPHPPASMRILPCPPTHSKFNVLAIY